MAASENPLPNAAMPQVRSAGLDADTLNVLGDVSNLDFGANARAAIVNRTHRVVRERANQMQAQRSIARELVIPLAVCSALLLMLTYAAWTVFSGTAAGLGTELEEEASKLLTGPLTDVAGSGYVLLLWFLPVSAVALGTVMFRRTRDHRERIG